MATTCGPSKTTPTKPPTLHVKISDAKPEQRFSTLAYDDDDDDYDEPLQHFRATMTDPDDDDDADDPDSAPHAGHINVANDVDDLPDGAQLADDVSDFDMTGHDGPVTHVTTILQAVDAQLRQRTPETLARAHYPHLAYANIDALLFDPFFTTVFRDPDYSVIRFPTGLIASCLTPDLDRARSRYSSPESPAINQPRRRATPRYIPESPPREPDDLLQDDITYDLSASSAFQSSSASVPPRPASVPPRPTKPRSPPPPVDLPPPAPASPPEWGNAPLYAPAVAPAPWQAFAWGNDVSYTGPEPEPQPWGPTRPPSRSSSESNPDDESQNEFPYYDEDRTHLQQYMQTASSFKGGTTVNAIAHVRDTRNPNYPLATRSLVIGLDSYSDVTVAHRDIVYDVRPVHENLSTGGGKTSISSTARARSAPYLPSSLTTRPISPPSAYYCFLAYPKSTSLTSSSTLTTRRVAFHCNLTTPPWISRPIPTCSAD